MALTCIDCGIVIKGDFTRYGADPIHVRCLRKRIEAQPNFAGWTLRRRSKKEAKP